MDMTCANEKMAEENDEALESDKEEDETRPGPLKRAKSATGGG